MTAFRLGARTAPFAFLLLAAAARADGHPQHNPTYFGLPGAGPYGPVYKYQHPWTYSIFGHRYYKNAEHERMLAEREYRIAMGQHIAAMNRIHERQSLAYLYGDARNAVVPVGHCNGNYGQGFGQAANDHIWWHAFNGGGKGCKSCKDGCGKGCKGCQEHFGQECPHCGKKGFGHFGCSHCHAKNNLPGGAFGGAGAGGAFGGPAPPYYSAYPGMNREDALRYLEGFQYYPPYHLNRSPRDFYMFDVRHNLGK
jgi:hypothetical protein